MFGMPEQVFQHGSPFPVFSSLQTPPAACPGPGRIPLALVCSLHRWVAGVHAATLSSRRPQSSMPRTAMPDGRMMEEWTGRVDSPRCLFYATFLRRSIQSWRPRTTIPDSNIVVGGVWSSHHERSNPPVHPEPAKGITTSSLFLSHPESFVPQDKFRERSKAMSLTKHPRR